MVVRAAAVSRIRARIRLNRQHGGGVDAQFIHITPMRGHPQLGQSTDQQDDVLIIGVNVKGLVGGDYRHEETPVGRES